MKRTRVDDLHMEWMKNPKYGREYEALEEEFSLSPALIEARSRTGLTQAQVAQVMETTQAVVARLEGVGTMPSTRTLENYARPLEWGDIIRDLDNMVEMEVAINGKGYVFRGQTPGVAGKVFQACGVVFPPTLRSS